MFAGCTVNVSIGRAAGKTESKCGFPYLIGFEYIGF